MKKQPKQPAKKQLSQADQKELDSLFLIAQDYLNNFEEAGLVLAKIKELGGYQGKEEWDAACKTKLVLEGKPLSGRYADCIIAAAKQAERLRRTNCAPMPANEAQARALGQLPEDLQGPAMEALGAGGEKITAKRIDELAKKANNGEDPDEVIKQSLEKAKKRAKRRTQESEQTKEEKQLGSLRAKLNKLRVDPLKWAGQARGTANKLVGIVDSDQLDPALERLRNAADELVNAAAAALDVLAQADWKPAEAA